jgi:hypothetical protein
MISYNRFQFFLVKELLAPIFIIPQGYVPSCSTKIADFKKNNDHYRQFYDSYNHGQDFNGNCIWWYEEPLNFQDLKDLSDRTLLLNPDMHPECREWYDCEIPSHGPIMYHVNFQIFANSEKSSLKKQWLKKNPPLLDWYFFFHGFAALDWFRDFQYLQNICEHKISKVFICLNHLLKDNRSYRLYLLSMLEQNHLTQHGLVSSPMLSNELIKDEIFNPESRLSKEGKKHIIQYLYGKNSLAIDNVNYNLASADIPDFFYKALWNVVTETNFYDEKLHLTEKIFKPIAIKRPFILVSAAGNLDYLKSYGFMSFDKWIDESYDSESDPDIRLKMIVKEITKLCQLTKHELDIMHREMQEVLEYNHDHFFNKFKKIIVDEMVDNFESCTKQYNLSLSERFRLPTELIDFNSVKTLLMK